MNFSLILSGLEEKVFFWGAKLFELHQQPNNNGDEGIEFHYLKWSGFPITFVIIVSWVMW